MTEEWARLRGVEEALLRLERQTPLLHFFQPLEQERFVRETTDALLFQRQLPPERLPKLPDFRKNRRTLEGIRAELTRFSGRLVELFEARAAELEQDMLVIEARGTTALVSAAARRFSFEESELAAARELAASFLVQPDLSEGGALVDVLGMFCEAIAKGKLPLVAVEANLVANAALGDGVILVRRGLVLPELEARRVVTHELQGHFERRRRDRVRDVGLAIGMPDCDADEEGYAVWLEESRGLLSANRKRDLALRFELSILVRRGAGLRELVAHAQERQFGVDQAVRAALRVLRGGGLHRELVYLAGFARVKREIEADGGVAAELASGRSSIRGLRYLKAPNHL